VSGDRRPAAPGGGRHHRPAAGGQGLVTDGPFAESRDWIAGFDILDCADLDEAIELASRHPMAATGRLELRPFWPLDEPDGRR
jgi:hypothetical protein